LSIFPKKCRAGILHEDLYTFLIVPRSVLLRMGNLTDKCCTEKHNTHFRSNNFFSEKCVVYMNVER